MSATMFYNNWMSDSKNPYQSPKSVGESELSDTETRPDFEPIFRESDKNGMLGVAVFGSALVAMDYIFAETGFFLVFGPPVIFFILTVWGYYAANRNSGRFKGVLLLLGALLSIITVPAAEFALVCCCAPANELVGTGWDLHGSASGLGSNDGIKILGLIATFVCTFGVSFVLYWLMSKVNTNRGDENSEKDAPAKEDAEA